MKPIIPLIVAIAHVSMIANILVFPDLMASEILSQAIGVSIISTLSLFVKP